MHLNHKPGEVLQVDWAGDTASVIDTDTGEVIPAYVFVATLPYSGYSYLEAFFSMNQEAWTTAHVNACKYFGGVTRIIQCDNLKTGVQKRGKDEIVLNKSYQELAEHYGTAILPARVRAPKEKAAVEGTVGIISTFILAALRNRQFLSLLELNEAIGDRLEAFNQKPFQKREGSRASSFAAERPFLRTPSRNDPVYLHGLAGLMFQTHGSFGFVDKVGIVLIELCGLIRQLTVCAALLTVFYPEQTQCHATLLHLLVDMLIVRHLVLPSHGSGRIQSPGHLCLAQGTDIFPGDSFLLCPLNR